MVEQYSSRGVKDWIVQRITAILIGSYTNFFLLYSFRNRPIHFSQWHSLFCSTLVKIFTFVVLLSVVWHSWIGLWTVLTDYIKNHLLRLLLETVVILLLVGYLSWGFYILWSTG